MQRLFSGVRWSTAFTWIVTMIAAAGLYTYRLTGHPGGWAAGEQQLPSVHQLMHALVHLPVLLPAGIAQLSVAVWAPHDSAFYSRLPSVGLGLITVGLLCWLLQRWYGNRLALLGGALVISAPWLLHDARLATSAIVYPLAMTTTLVLSALWHAKKPHSWLLVTTALLCGLLVYIPGGIWLVLCLVLIEANQIARGMAENPALSALGSIVFLLCLVPLGHDVLVNWHVYREFIGLPAQLPSPQAYGKQLLEVWRHVFIGGYSDARYNIPSLPLVDFITAISFVLGAWLYAKHWRAGRPRLLLSLWLIGTLLAGLGIVHISALLPIVLVVAVSGLGYLLHRWLKVFPRNPLARSFGIGFVSLIVAFAVVYNVRSYFIAWPNDPAVKTTFRQP